MKRKNGADGFSNGRFESMAVCGICVRRARSKR